LESRLCSLVEDGDPDRTDSVEFSSPSGVDILILDALDPLELVSTIWK
jgi:hypothetical protein